MSDRTRQDYDKVTRFEVIDHRPKGGGRVLVALNCDVEAVVLDDGLTLKVFLYEQSGVDMENADGCPND